MPVGVVCSELGEKMVLMQTAAGTTCIHSPSLWSAFALANNDAHFRFSVKYMDKDAVPGDDEGVVAVLATVLVAVDAPHPAARHPLLTQSPLIFLHLLLGLAHLSSKSSSSIFGIFAPPSLLLKLPS